MARGRPREFDVDKALELALQVFWGKGYEGASMTDLTETMGITKPSLYSAFGNKEELFRKALDRYVDGPGGYVQVALGKPTVRGVVEHLLYEAADAVTDPNHPPGCLAVQGALSCGDAAESIKQELMSRRANGEEDLRKRFDRAIAEGDLPAGSDAADLAAYISAILQGMAVQAAGGTSRPPLRKIAEMALRTWTPPARAGGRAPGGPSRAQLRKIAELALRTCPPPASAAA